MPHDDVAVQDFYPADFAHCHGCGRLNDHGLHIRTIWNGTEGVARFTPGPWHIALPGFVYGGLIASLIDCHAIGTAAAASEQAQGRQVGDADAPRFVTASLKVEYVRPTPLGPDLELRATPRDVGARKVFVDVTVSANGTVTARGEVLAVLMPESMRR